jgi:hypothetical protein
MHYSRYFPPPRYLVCLGDIDIMMRGKRIGEVASMCFQLLMVAQLLQDELQQFPRVRLLWEMTVSIRINYDICLVVKRC